jgi:hypothetical protein
MATRSAISTHAITRFAISRVTSRNRARLSPASVNLTLAALDNLYLFLGLGRPNVRREDLPKEAPRALEPEEQKRFMRAVERCTSIPFGRSHSQPRACESAIQQPPCSPMQNCLGLWRGGPALGDRSEFREQTIGAEFCVSLPLASVHTRPYSS